MGCVGWINFSAGVGERPYLGEGKKADPIGQPRRDPERRPVQVGNASGVAYKTIKRGPAEIPPGRARGIGRAEARYPVLMRPEYRG